MKAKFLVAALFATATSAAIASELVHQCDKDAVRAAVETNAKSLNSNTNSCGLKALNLGQYLETYVACTSDETDPMEYIVVMEKVDMDATGKPARCERRFVAVSTDSATPTFDSKDGLINTVECSMDASDAEAVCR